MVDRCINILDRKAMIGQRRAHDSHTVKTGEATNTAAAVETFGGESGATIAAITTTTTTVSIKTNSVVSRVHVVDDDYSNSDAAVAAAVPTYERSIPTEPPSSDATNNATTNRKMSGTSLLNAATHTYPWLVAASDTFRSALSSHLQRGLDLSPPYRNFRGT
jgi:hypothetical protein